MTLHKNREKRMITGAYTNRAGKPQLSILFGHADMAWLVTESGRLKMPAAALVRVAVKAARKRDLFRNG